MRLGVLGCLSLALAAGCQSTGGGGRSGGRRGGARKPKSKFAKKRKKKGKAAPKLVIRASVQMARDMDIPLPLDAEPETHRAPADQQSVVCKVVRVEDGGATIIVQVPEDRELVAGEELSVFMTVAPLPPSRYLKDHKKELYIARAVVVECGGGECRAEIDDLFAEGPVQPGDLAIARGY